MLWKLVGAIKRYFGSRGEPVLDPALEQISSETREQFQRLGKRSVDSFEKALFIARIHVPGAILAGMGGISPNTFGERFCWVPYSILHATAHPEVETVSVLGWPVDPPISVNLLIRAYCVIILEKAESRHSSDEIKELREKLDEYILQVNQPYE